MGIEPGHTAPEFLLENANPSVGGKRLSLSDLIDKNGLVSHEVAKAMALGAKKNYGTDFAISTTGNAGPTKGDNNEDIGIVFIGIATPEKVESFRFNMGNNRTRVIQKTVNQAFEILYDSLVKS